jgi:SAM-dependent methyltransferase
MLYRFLKGLKSDTNEESNGRHLIPTIVSSACSGISRPSILDVGAGYGIDLKSSIDRIARPARAVAIETFPQAIDYLRGNVTNEIFPINIEQEPIPFQDKSFDVVICNQVMEHVKEIFWVTSELARVTKIGGTIILGVPNLGSLHNRVLLMLGKQPAAIHVFGPHVRGYTISGMKDFLERGGTLTVRSVLGANFYPFPPRVSRPLSRITPSLSVSSFYIVKRTGEGNFLSLFDTPAASELVDTPYFRGPLGSSRSEPSYPPPD